MADLHDNRTIETTLFCGQCAFDRPAIRINPLRDCRSAESSFLGPITERHCDPIKGEQSCAGLVPTLFMRCFPLNIVWFIVQLVVDSTKRVMLTWSKSNVLKKVFKHKPSITHGDTNSTVSVEPLHGWVFAASNHSVPRSPFFGSFPTNRVSVSSHTSSKSVMESHYMDRLGFV